jgi:hypothetical protein
MQRRSKSNNKLAVICGAVLGAGVIGCLGAGWSMGQLQSQHLEPVLAPTDVVALRFPDELLETEAAQSSPSPAQVDAATAAPETAAIFDPNPTYPSMFVPQAAPAQRAPAPALIEVAAVSQSDPAQQPAATASRAQLASATDKLTAAVHRNAAATKPAAVLSDGQIASIRRRLKLTPDQQQMWPAVEAALRNLTYAKRPDATHRNGGSQDGVRVATIDTSSQEVLNLTSAAYPLVMSFSDDQKRELNVLAHVAGLEQLVPKF